jgi:hypothetical protein
VIKAQYDQQEVAAQLEESHRRRRHGRRRDRAARLALLLEGVECRLR